jgi:hypothetical protein
MTTGHPFLRRRVRPTPPGQDARPTAATSGTAASAGTTAAHGVPISRPAAPAAPAPATPASSGGGLSLSFGRQPAPSADRTPASRTSAAPTSGAARVPAPGTTAPAQPRPDRIARRLAERASRIRPFPAPDPRDVRVLGPEDPVVRIDRRRSAVGALRVTGSTSAAWESVVHVVGAATADGASAGRTVTTRGNRPLVGYDGADVLVALRHVRELRRALVMGRGPDRLVVALHDGTTLAVDPGDADTITILALSVIDGELELRAEPFPRATHDGDVFAAFGFVLSAPTVGV